MFGTVQDITDRKRTQDKIREQETELRQIVDLAPQLVTVFGPHRERLYANRILLDYLGISLDEWRQRPDSIEFLHPDDRERVGMLILIVLCLMALLTSWSSECARAAETIAGF